MFDSSRSLHGRVPGTWENLLPDDELEQHRVLSEPAVRQLRTGRQDGHAGGPPRPGVPAGAADAGRRRPGGVPGAVGQLAPGPDVRAGGRRIAR